MSRRRENDVDRVFIMIQLVCQVDQNHHIGKVVRQRGQDKLEAGLQRIDGPNGETKVQAVCRVCSGREISRATPQMRWDRLRSILDEMEATGQHYLALDPSDVVARS